MSLSYPGPQARDGQAHFFCILCPSPLLLAPLSYAPLQMDVPSPFALLPHPSQALSPHPVQGRPMLLVLLHFGTRFHICLWCVSSS